MHLGLRAAGALALWLLMGVASAQAQDASAGHHQVAVDASSAADKQNEKAARDAFERGRSFYDAGAFDQAANAFSEAYRLSGRDQLLYNLYLAQRDANHPAEAAEALRGYLKKVPNVENRSQLEARLAALDAGLAREREQREAVVQAQAQIEARAASAAQVPAKTDPAMPVAAIETKRSNKFWASIGLMSVGGAMMLSSIATGALAHNHQQKLEDQCPSKVNCDPSLQSTADSGKTLAHATDGLLFGGIAMAAGGAALMFLFHGLERVPNTPPPVTASCSATGCMAQTTLRF